jgi:hypothetical protein
MEAPMRAPALVPFLVLALTASAGAKTMVPITACSDVVPRGAIGYLTGDVDCAGLGASAGVVLLPGSGLELRGFTITGAIFGVGCFDIRDNGYGPGFYSGGSCRIDGGGGSIVASEAHGIAGTRVDVKNLTIDGAGQEGVSADKIRLENVTITNCLGDGAAGKGIFASGSTITNSGEDGIAGRTVRLVGTTVTGNGIGPTCGGNLWPNRCADLVTTKRPRLKDSECGSSLVPVQLFPARTWGVCPND